ncbi:MAG: ubiE1 [Bacteroidetes bacterium]|jgi:ubiquinone/menaquinone biosynthesis C-methylase UbiE|nr:ubiE1 [Bacteroidota bacterium]
MTYAADNGYDKRDVDYSLIHHESKEVFTKFIRSMELQEGMKLLDIGGGYGSVFMNISDLYPELSFQYDLLDSSEKQLGKAKTAIASFLENKRSGAAVNYIHRDAVHLDLPADMYDIVVCKMFIHEIPEVNQALVHQQIFSVIKPGGCVLFWTADLDESDHAFYSETIRKKDELAGFHSFVANRHFLLNTQLETLLAGAGFGTIEKLFDFEYELHTSARLQSEFQGNVQTLTSWHDHILEAAGKLKPEEKKQMLIEVSSSNIHIRFKRAVFKALKG